METVAVTRQEDYAVVKLQRGKANPINMQVIEELREAFRELAEDETVRGAILTGREGVFSAGLDVVDLNKYDMPTFEKFWRAYAGFAEDLLAFSKPLIAALTGHAPAGGCILALCCDYRVMAEGPYVIGLNEVAINLALPGPIGELLAFVVGYPKAYQLVLNGAMLPSAEALAAGLVDEICPLDKVVERAVAKLKQWLIFGDNAWRQTKYAIRKPVREAFAGNFEELYGEAARQWWSPEGQETRAKLCALLGK